MLKKNPIFAAIPMRWVGPIQITGPLINEEIKVPLATLESPLWPSVARGATVSRLSGGIKSLVLKECMTRSVIVEATDASVAAHVLSALEEERSELERIVSLNSRFARLENWHTQIIGKLIYIRFSLTTGDAAGHNMATLAADKLLDWILQRFPKLRYVSISGNYCTDKKASAVNGILGRGKYVVAEMQISAEVCKQYLRTTPDKMVELNIKKNLLGSLISGSIRTANAHFANMLLALYLATGQDAANIVEGSQGFVHAEKINEDLYFSVTLPNVIVGTVGAGKNLAFVQDNLQKIGCLAARAPGENARRLAAVVGATVLCGELSLLAAQTNPKELMESHLRLERLEKATTI